MNELNIRNIVISIIIIIFFGILSIFFQNIIGMLSVIYIPMIAILNYKNFSTNYWTTFLIFSILLIINEIIIRVLGEIGINSAGNPWAVLFFYGTLFFSLFTIYIESARQNLNNISSKFLYSTLIFGTIGILYFLITKPI